MKKRFLIAAMAMSLVASMTACGGSSETSSDDVLEDTIVVEETTTEATTEALTETESDLIEAFGGNAGSIEEEAEDTDITVAGITFTVPAIFANQEESDGQQMFYAVDGDTMGIILFTTDDAEGATAEDLVSVKDDVVEGIIENYDNSELIASEEGELAGLPAIGCAYTADIEGNTCSLETYMTVSNDQILCVQYIETAENDDFRQAFEDMVNNAY